MQATVGGPYGGDVLVTDAVRPYLSADQLAARTPWTVEAIGKMVTRGVLKRDVHYFQPFGRRSRLVFKWSAIVALIEGQPVPTVDPLVVDETLQKRRVPKTAPGIIDVQKATTDLQRLLG